MKNNNINENIINHIIMVILDEVELSGECEADHYFSINEKNRAELIKHINYVLKYDVEVCSECYKEIQDEEFITDYEDRGKEGCQEQIVTGYKCGECGHEETY